MNLDFNSIIVGLIAAPAASIVTYFINRKKIKADIHSTIASGANDAVEAMSVALDALRAELEVVKKELEQTRKQAAKLYKENCELAIQVKELKDLIKSIERK